MVSPHAVGDRPPAHQSRPADRADRRHLSSHEDQWKTFYVQWGIGAVIVLGALEGAVMIRGEGRLAEIADRDVADAGDGAVKWSAEYDALFRRLGTFGALMQLIVVLTVLFMAAHIGA